MGENLLRIYTEGGPRAARRLLEMLNAGCAADGFPGPEGPWRMEPQNAAGTDGFVLTLRLNAKDFAAFRRTGAALARYVREEAEPGLLKELVRTEHGVLDEAEAARICASAEKRLAATAALRVGFMAGAFAAYLERERRLHLEGFIRFRLGTVREELREALQAAVRERLPDRQYEQFTALLRLIVEHRESQLPVVHVHHSGGQAFRLYDGRLRPLRFSPGPEENGSGDPADGQDAPEESRIVSCLLSAAPRRIYIYTEEPDARVIRTLVGIFGDRAAVCPGRFPP